MRVCTSDVIGPVLPYDASAISSTSTTSLLATQDLPTLRMFGDAQAGQLLRVRATGKLSTGTATNGLQFLLRIQTTTVLNETISILGDSKVDLTWTYDAHVVIRGDTATDVNVIAAGVVRIQSVKQATLGEIWLLPAAAPSASTSGINNSAQKTIDLSVAFNNVTGTPSITCQQMSVEWY
jgi:chromosome condensin MukBEF complex kleisin-like MukF subunit